MSLKVLMDSDLDVEYEAFGCLFDWSLMIETTLDWKVWVRSYVWEK